MLEGLSEPLTQFHFRSSIRPVARKRLQRTISEETQSRHTASHINALFSACFRAPTGVAVRVPSLQLVLDAGLRPLHAARVPPLMFAVSWRGRRQPQPEERGRPISGRLPGRDTANQRGGERSEDAAALFNGD